MTIEDTMETPVTAFLQQKGIRFKIKPHKNAVYTSEDAARERGVKVSQIIKTMVLIGADGSTVVAILPGDKRLDLKKAKRLVDKKDLNLMNPENVARTFGLTVGAIAPIGSELSRFLHIVDPSVFLEEVVDISSGSPEAGVELKSSDLKGLLANAVIAPISK